MPHSTSNEDPRLALWLRVREFAVPPSMIDSATARRSTGDWAAACAAAHVDVDLNLRRTAHLHGRELAARLRTDLRHLAPDLLRWHMPRIAPNGLLRPGLTLSLARYHEGNGTVHLVARTPPAWADAGQRISLALWDGSRAGPHPHPHPNRRFRLDLHRHLWDARRAGELRARSETAPHARGWAVDRWPAEARLLLCAEGQDGGTVAVRVGGRRQMFLDVDASRAGEEGPAPPILPDAATWVLPDLALLRAGLIEAGRLHPLVAAALVPGRSPGAEPHGHQSRNGPRMVECGGARHRVALVNGALVALDHDATEIRREKLLAELTGTPLPCLQLIEEAHRSPECLLDVHARLEHGDAAGAQATVDGLLGSDARLPEGSLRDVLEEAARRRIDHGLFRAGLLSGPGPAERPDRRSRRGRARPRHAIFR
ncbi:hypothetical protein [Streptosporangium pseudovulgare]|uniref:Uncharacterized protein n=1 Tax=Streptosporangium pseudovulgare TaxID=35765 RepID=A0ABQ2R091_9ACTN|nr:hypothetical protein [Streptosporangium pseudovulgare]GGQ06638.1 hypothetical protein GCM10010140_41020 [Streptosporangium pseudovulgare]